MAGTAKEAGIGHNSRPALVDYVERFERLADDKKAAVEEFTADMKTLKDEVKSAGYTASAFSELIRRRKWEKDHPDATDDLESYEGIFG